HVSPAPAIYSLSLHDALPICAQQAQARDLRDQFGREPALLEALADDRQHALVGETGDGVLDRALLLAEQGTDVVEIEGIEGHGLDRKSTRLNSSHVKISYAVC